MFQLIDSLDNRTKKWKWNWICFFSVLFIVFSFQQIKNINEYYCDSVYYSGIAETIVGDGENHDEAYYNEAGNGILKINLLNYPETFRGYFWPTVIGLTRGACIVLFKNGYLGWRIIASFMMAIILAFALPGVFNKKWLTIRDWFRLMLMLIVVLIYWGDFLSFPLSDMAAFGFMCCGCALQRYILENERIRLVKKILIMTLIGALFYASYNTRVAYLYGIVIAVIIFVVLLVKKKSNSMSAVVFLVVGAILVALPQMAINHKYTGSYTPRVITEQYTGYQRGLEWQQIYWGLSQSRYETYIGDEGDYPTAKVNFYDAVGKEILEREGVQVEDFGVIDYFKLVAKYPLDFCGIYVRHLISLMTPTFKDVYIRDIHVNKGVFSSIAIVMWILAYGLMIDTIKHKKGLKNITTYLNVAMMLPGVLQCFGSVELRFFLGVYMIMYFYVFCMADYQVVKNCFVKKRLDVLLICIIVFILWITVWGNTLAQNEVYTMLIHDTQGVKIHN